MATPVEEFAAFNISEALELAKSDYEKHGKNDGDTTVHLDGGPCLTIRGWYRIVLHEELRIRALKRQVNRLIAGETIEGDEEPYLVDECWLPEEEET